MSDLAVYSIEWRIAGMKIPGKPEGVGDRSLRFEYQMDPADEAGATEAWYEHLAAMLGPDELTKVRAFAEGQARRK